MKKDKTNNKAPVLSNDFRLRAHKHEIAGLMMLFASTMLLVGVQIERSGLILHLVNWLYGFVGGGIYILSLCLWMTGLDIFRVKPYKNQLLLSVGWILLLFSAMALFHDISEKGGIFGAAISGSLAYIFGPSAGKYLAELLLLTIGLTLITDILFSSILSLGARYLFSSFMVFIHGFSGFFKSLKNSFAELITASSANVKNHDIIEEKNEKIIISPLEKTIDIQAKTGESAKGSTEYKSQIFSQIGDLSTDSNQYLDEIGRLSDDGGLILDDGNGLLEKGENSEESLAIPIKVSFGYEDYTEEKGPGEGDEKEPEKGDKTSETSEGADKLENDKLEDDGFDDDEFEDDKLEDDGLDDGEFEDDNLEDDKLEDGEKYENDDELEDGDRISEENKKNAPAPLEFILPDVSLLDPPGPVKRDSREHLLLNAQKILEKLKNFRIEAKILDICQGPAITRYELEPSASVKVADITKLSDDLAMALAAKTLRIEAPIPGKSAIGIEIPNSEPAAVYFKEVAEKTAFLEHKSLLALVLGKDISGDTMVADLAKMPHLLIAGSTGSGKSVCINAIIASMLLRAKPDQVKMIMIDPKMVEMSIYKGIPHLLLPPVTDAKDAAVALAWAVEEMERRYRLLADNQEREITSYNKLAEEKIRENPGSDFEKLPYIVVIIDELADLMMMVRNEVEDAICRIAQKARAVGIHLVVATQRPSVKVITGLIKANIPCRISFAVTSNTDSRTILNMGGAENLIGRGDMLYIPPGTDKPIRIQGAFLSTPEVVRIVDHLRDQKYEAAEAIVLAPQASQAGKGSIGDRGDYFSQEDRLADAVKLVVETNNASVSFLQRKLNVGHPRAGKIMDMMEELGVVGAQESTKPREILMTVDELRGILPPGFIGGE